MGECNRYNRLLWISCVKGQLDSSLASEMKIHSESCAECKAELDFFNRIEALADMNSLLPPDEWTLEAAARFESRELPGDPSIYGEMIFDSSFHDTEAVRSRRTETRHLVFDLPDFEVDLALEQSGTQLNMLMGHILSKSPAAPAELSGIGLQLKIDTQTFETTPNELGEFIFKVGARMGGETLELRCASEEGPCAIILIPC
jgi:hypothetical protein